MTYPKRKHISRAFTGLEKTTYVNYAEDQLQDFLVGVQFKLSHAKLVRFVKKVVARYPVHTAAVITMFCIWVYAANYIHY